MNITRVIKIASCNLIILSVLLVFWDLLFGKYFDSAPALNIPGARVGETKIYDTSSIERHNKITKVTYSRNSDGYRPFDESNLETDLVLTIGGSTTDQIYIDNAKTWQRILEKEINVPVVNGGVDGQSSFGHLFSLNNWHSKVLNPEIVSDIVLYIGVNDVRFAKGLAPAYGNEFDSPTSLDRFRAFLARRSFLYEKLKEAKRKYDVVTGVKLSLPDGAYHVGHRSENPSFLKTALKTDAPLSTDEEIREYKQLFRDLIASSISNFPTARIHVVQQQAPVCLISGTRVLRRVSEDEISNLDQYCSGLASIYKAQELVLSELANKNIFLTKMYIDNPIPDEGFYDGLHTNSLGSRLIGDYLAKTLSWSFHSSQKY